MMVTETIPMPTEVYVMGNAGFGFGFGKPAFWIGLAVGAAAGFFGYRYMERKKAEQNAIPADAEGESVAGLIEAESGKGANG